MNEFEERMRIAFQEITTLQGQFIVFAGNNISTKDKNEIDHSLRMLQASIQQDIINGKPPLAKNMREVNANIISEIIARLAKYDTAESRTFSKRLLAVLDKAKMY